MLAFAHRPTTWLILAALLLIIHAGLYSFWMDWDVVDDAYISFRYALNAARLNGLTFNAGERRVEGYTNFLWTVMLIPVFWFKLPVHTVSLVLGTLWALGCLFLVWRFTCETEGPPWLAPIVALLLAVDGSFALWAVGGLEAPLFAFLILGGALAYLRETRDPAVRPLSGAWFALAAMTRPEGLLIYGLTGLHQVITRLVCYKKLTTRQDWGRLGLFLLIWGTWFAFRWRYYGFLLPNTFYAKVTLDQTDAQRARGLEYVQTFIRIHLGYLPLLIALLPLFCRRCLRWSSYLVLLVVVYGIYIAFVGGDWSVGRFFVPVLPLFYLLLARGLLLVWATILRWFDRRQSKRRPAAPGVAKAKPGIRILAGFLVVASAGALWIQSSLHGEKALFLDPFDARLAGWARTAMGKWLRENVPPDTYIAVDAAGQIPFYSDLRALDLYGLNDLNIAHSQVASMGEGTPGHEKMDMNYVIFNAQPDYIIIYGTAFDWLSAYSYERIDLPWTDDPQLKAFLGVYERQWSGK